MLALLGHPTSPRTGQRRPDGRSEAPTVMCNLRTPLRMHLRSYQDHFPCTKPKTRIEVATWQEVLTRAPNH